jgi:hypothetical protein
LNLSNNRITSIETVKALLKLPKLRQLNLKANNLSSWNDFHLQNDALPALSFLDLSFNNMQDESIKTIIDHFGKSLRHLILNGNDVSDMTFAMLVDNTKLPNLKTLHVSNIKSVTVKSTEALLKSENKTITSIDLSRTGITLGQAAQALSAIPFLRTVILADMHKMQNTALQEDTNLKSLLSQVPSLMWLDISDNGICISDHVMQLLFTHPNLVHLDVGGNKFLNGIFPESIANNTSLNYLNLSHSIDLSRTSNAQLLAKIPNLSSLNVQQCNVTDELAVALATSKSLKVLNLSSNDNLTLQGGLAFKDNSVLETLDLSYCGKCSKGLKANGGKDLAHIKNLFLGPDIQDDEFAEFDEYVAYEEETMFDEFETDENAYHQYGNEEEQQGANQYFYDQNTQQYYYYDPNTQQYYYAPNSYRSGYF